MYGHELPWKEFNISLPAIDVWVRANYPTGYTGTSADSKLTLWFTDEPDEATKQHIQDYWDGLSEESEEATSYISSEVLAVAIQSAREDAVTKTWDQLSVAQKKLLAGLTPTREDLGL